MIKIKSNQKSTEDETASNIDRGGVAPAKPQTAVPRAKEEYVRGRS
jgi:hypothetical protein